MDSSNKLKEPLTTSTAHRLKVIAEAVAMGALMVYAFVAGSLVRLVRTTVERITNR